MLHERARLELELGERDGDVEDAKRQAARWAQFQRVVEQAESVLDPWPFPAEGDFSVLRGAILDAERGLGLSRSSVAFRPDSQVAAGFRGVRVEAIERGDSVNLWAFLKRVSQWNAPLAPVELTLAEESGGAGSVRLAMTWIGLWSEDGSVTDLSSEALGHLDNWLRRVRDDWGRKALKRDIFRKVTEPASVVSIEPTVSPSPPEAGPLRLVGFIFSGGSMGEENPLAAVRYEGRMWLVRPGDSIGTYRVERLVVGEEIHLVDPDTGETVRLVLE
jgi:hypothetical protein